MFKDVEITTERGAKSFKRRYNWEGAVAEMLAFITHTFLHKVTF